MVAPVNQPAPPPADCPADRPPRMAHVVERNIRALTDVRKREDDRRKVSDRVADAITRFAGTMWFVYVHLLLYGGWLALNSGRVPGVTPWDPFPFVMLAMAASVEAIFLSTFILISQNRMQKLADRRAELDLQISLLTEHELTRAIHLLDAVATRLGVERPPDPEMRDIKADVEPEKVVEAIERAEESSAGG
ncbi:MAG TPA: DUF1003 domain-containing protein [Humisphaera sp.]